MIKIDHSLIFFIIKLSLKNGLSLGFGVAGLIMSIVLFIYQLASKKVSIFLKLRVGYFLKSIRFK